MVENALANLISAAIHNQVEPTFVSEVFRSRANYLVHCLWRGLDSEDEKILQTHKPTYCIFESATLIGALVSFLTKLGAGIYLSEKIIAKLSENESLDRIYFLLIDPHTLSDFESKMKATRVGVLIRRPIIGTNDFQTICPLEKQQ